MIARRVICAGGVALGSFFFLLSAAFAQPIVYTNFPWGTVTVFDAGDRATRVSATLAGVGSDELLYASATVLPASAQVTSGTGGTQRLSRATLAITESNISGLAIDGDARLNGSGLTLGSEASVALTLFIQLNQGAVIRVADLRTAVSPSGGVRFTLLPSDEAGNVSGDPLALSGPVDDRYFVSTTAADFLLTMDAFVVGTSVASSSFAYRFDLDSLASVPIPEPSVTGLAVGGIGFGLAVLRCRRRQVRHA